MRPFKFALASDSEKSKTPATLGFTGVRSGCNILRGLATALARGITLETHLNVHDGFRGLTAKSSSHAP